MTDLSLVLVVMFQDSEQDYDKFTCMYAGHKRYNTLLMQTV